MANSEIAFDQQAADAFAERMLAILNHGALALMISIGHRTALFDTMAGKPPATSAALAAAAGLSERYVREWLAALVTGGVIDYDPAARTYTLPAEHAAWLTRAASPNNFAVTAQFIPLLGAVEDGIIMKFQGGGGLHYHDYPRFHAVMAEDSAQTVVAALTDQILPLVPGLTERLEQGITVLDLGCGKGLALLTLAERFPRSQFVGYDFGAEARRAAEDRAATEAQARRAAEAELARLREELARLRGQ